MSKHALICGISGQDGAYLAKWLLEKGYTVTGTSRNAVDSPFENLKRIGIFKRVNVISMDVGNFESVMATIKVVVPDEIYNLAAQSSVGLSFQKPVETLQSIAVGTLHILEAMRLAGCRTRFYSAGTSECFGNAEYAPVTEDTPFNPCSPYAVAKVAAHHLVANYRDAYGIYACTGILFNHESPIRPEHYVSQKIVRTAVRIALGSKEKLHLGNLDINRDWGWAPEYVEAMWLMLQSDTPQDFVIATGQAVSLKYFVEKTFSYLGLAILCSV
jgi:GDPmannose 4,6-dehydratase